MSKWSSYLEGDELEDLDLEADLSFLEDLLLLLLFEFEELAEREEDLDLDEECLRFLSRDLLRLLLSLFFFFSSLL